jgi:hypothetical protein
MGLLGILGMYYLLQVSSKKKDNNSILYDNKN